MSQFVRPHPSAAGSSDTKRAQPLTKPGFSDALGDRQLSLDDTIGTTVEILRFKKELGDAPAFEAAIRQRVDDLRRLLHPSLPTLRGVDRLSDGHLALISDHVPGRRLSEILQTARGPVFAVELIRQLTPALATIQRPHPNLAHGLVTADRVIVTREGRLVVVEHALGSAVESLKLPAAKLRAQFGLALADTGGPVRLDQRTDVIQLGFVALTLLLGRRLDPGAFRVGIPALLDEFSQASPREAAALRPWFERALQIAEQPFETAEDALEALEELPDNDELGPKGPPRSILMFRSPTGDAPPQPRPLATVPVPEAAPADDPAGATVNPGNPGAQLEPEPAPAPVDDSADDSAEETPEEMARDARTRRKLTWMAAGFAILSVAEGAVIAGLLLTRPSGIIPAAAAAPLETSAATDVAADLSSPTDPTAPVTPTPATSAAPLPPPARTAPVPEPAADEPPPVAGRIGGARITAPIDLEVYQDGALLGSSAGPIALAEGSHTLEFVNDGLGYRTRQTVAVKAGQLTAVRVTVPQGRVNINATPWANVWIDGTAAGETPIANFALPIGTHEILFRHPQLGEQRTTATVRADTVARVSVTFSR